MITYDDKVSTVSNPLPDINKVTDADMNEIKAVVNANETALGTKVPDSRTITIDGVPHDLSADRSWTTTGGADKFPYVYNVLANGLVADGVTDNSTALAALVTLADAGSWIYFPSGTYFFGSTVTINTKILHLLGDGITSVLTMSADTVLLHYNEVFQLQIRNIKIANTKVGVPTSASVGLKGTVAYQWRVENLWVIGFYKNILMTNVWEDSWIGLNTQGYVHTGMERSNSGAFRDAGDCSISHSWFMPLNHNATYSLFQQNGGGTKITSCKFNWFNDPEAKAQYHFYYNGTENTVDIHISNCSFENWATAAIRIGVTGGATFHDVTIIGNDIGGTSSNGSEGIIMIGIEDGAIVGNALRANANGNQDAITLTNCDNFIIYNEYENWTNNLVNSGSTNINSPVQINSFSSVVDGIPVVFSGTTGKLVKAIPGMVDWTTGANVTGWSSFTTKYVYYIDEGHTIFITGALQGTGTGTTAGMTLPVAPNAIYSSTSLSFAGQVVNNATGAIGLTVMSGGSTAVSFFSNGAGGAWTNATNRVVFFSARYFK